MLSAVGTRAIPAVIALLCALTAAPGNPAWKTFTSGSGWRILYPPQWRISSCHACPDPNAAGIFVAFSSPPKAGLFPAQVQVYPLEGMADAAMPNLNERFLRLQSFFERQEGHEVRARRFHLNGLQASAVVCRSAAGCESEFNLVASGASTFLITFSPASCGPIEGTAGYAEYVRMRDSFKVTHQ